MNTHPVSRALLCLALLTRCTRPGTPASSDASPTAALPSTTQRAAQAAPSAPSTASAIPARILALRAQGLSPNCPSGMALVAGGTFKMGSIGNEPDDVKAPPSWIERVAEMLPAHVVSVAPFCIDIAPASVAEYRACVSAGPCTPPATTSERKNLGGDKTCNWARPGHEEHPVDCVSLDQAERYCKQKARRILTEVEWERAARGDDERALAYGDLAEKPVVCQAVDDGESTCAIATFAGARSPYGVFDMAYATGEWTVSPYCPYANLKCRTKENVIRGGRASWAGLTTSRNGIAASSRERDITFRCATTPTQTRE